MELILSSGLFDVEWYAATAGCSRDPVQAVAHFLTVGSDEGHTPHPMFDQKHLMRRYGDIIGDRNPLVAYLSDSRMRRASTQPLMAYRNYQRRHKEAGRYPRGVTRHYLEVGALKGFEPNEWYQVDADREPEGLADWLRARRREWADRHAIGASPWSSESPVLQYEIGAPDFGDALEGAPFVSVVLPTLTPTAALVESIASVLQQSVQEMELLLVHPESAKEEVEQAVRNVGPDDRVRLISVASGEAAHAVDVGVNASGGTWVAFQLPTCEWEHDHLANVIAKAQSVPCEAAYDIVERVARDGTPQYCSTPVNLARSLVASQVFLGTLVVRRSVLSELGGIDASMHIAFDHNLELQLLRRGPVPLVPVLGVRTSAEREAAVVAAIPLRDRPRFDLASLQSWHQLVIQRHLVDWPSGPGEPGLVSIIVPTHADSVMTTRAVASVVAARDHAIQNWEASDRATAAPLAVQVVVIDNGCPAEEAAALDSLPLQYDCVTVVHEPVNRGYALGNNVAIPHARGETLVFLNNDTEVRPNWLEPLVTALGEPDVHAAQSLLIYPSGSIQSAGVAFPDTGGVPHVLLQGFPVEDAAGLENEAFNALTAASLAVRREDVIELQGFDPLFQNGMEDVDLGLRLRALRGGRLSVRPSSTVLHHESRAPGRFDRSLVNRRLLLDRHHGTMPGDDKRLWRGRGYDVVGHELRAVGTDDRRVWVPEPVLARRSRLQVNESKPCLRWALKNPAPAGPESERWGDTHFIRRLAAAMRRLGQEVVIDHRAEFDRATGRHDDVVLVLRGLAPYRPVYGHVSLAWVISHPEMLSRREAIAYDRVFAASTTWSQRMSAEWGIRIDPLLQATDPALFHPDRGRSDTGHSLLFVGSSRKVLRPLVAAAVERGLPLSIYGNQWEGLVPERYIKQEYLANDEVGEAYRRASIVLNDHWDDMRAAGFLSNRLFDAAGSGARVVTDDVAGLDTLFGASVQVVHDAAELEALVTAPEPDLVFGDDEARRAVARHIHRDHSFDARAATLLEVATEIRARRQHAPTAETDR